MRSLSLGYRVLLAVFLGIFTGLFFGPLTAYLEPLGEIYTLLLKLSVLPYVFLSLVHGLGSLTPETGKKLFRCGWPYLLILWGVAISFIFLLIQLIPATSAYQLNISSDVNTGSHLSGNFLSYLIPQNPFYDFSHSIVPMIALLGLLCGLALMHVPNKGFLVDVLEKVNQTIEQILHWLGILAPLGAFVYISIAFGTIHFEDFQRLQVFVFAFILTTLFVTFWILPMLLAFLTPLSFREASQALRYICLLPFATGLPTAMLPFLNSYLKQLAAKHTEQDQFRETSQTVLPIAYSFGNIGNAMVLFFIIFLGYYYRHPISDLVKMLLTFLTIPLSIGSSAGSVNSVVFLTKQLGLPAGAPSFFLQLKSVTYNFQVMMSAGRVFTLILLTLYAYYGLLRIRRSACALRLGASLLLFALFIFILNSFVHSKDFYQQHHMQLQISDVIEHPVSSRILSSAEALPNSEQNLLEEIIDRKVLRVGFSQESIPFCYYNEKNELTGFDIAYAYQLASDLGCSLEFVPFDFGFLGENLSNNAFDLGMSSIIMSEKRLAQMDFSMPYWEDLNVLVVPRKKRKQFTHLSEVEERSELIIGAGGAQIALAQQFFPKAQIIDTIDNNRLVNGELDAIFWSGTSATIWCIAHPDFISIAYGNALGRNYFAYPFRKNALEFGFFLNNWLALKKQSGFEKAMRSYWIEGLPPEERAPRWSILRNVLHLSK